MKTTTKWSNNYQPRPRTPPHPTDDLWAAPPLIEPPVPYQAGRLDQDWFIDKRIKETDDEL
jgi:hypothetical protein